MSLEFRPPKELIEAYLNRPSPGQIAGEGIQNAMQLYVKQKALQDALKLKQQEVDISKQANSRENMKYAIDTGDLSMLQPGQRSELQDPIQGPSNMVTTPPTQGVGPENQTMVAPQVSPFVQRRREMFAKNPMGKQGMEMGMKEKELGFKEREVGLKENPIPTSTDEVLAQMIKNGDLSIEQAMKYKQQGAQPSYQFVGTQNGQPILMQPKTGQMIPGSLPGQGPLMSTTQTEGQGNAKLYAQRMEEADQQLSTLSKQMDLASLGSGLQRFAPNFMKSGNIQLVEQAQRNFLNAVLRRESGAVISPTEFSEGTKQYFEVMGDTPEVKQQKAMNRKTAIEGLRNSAGEMSQPQGQQQTQLPAVGGTFQGGKVLSVKRIN